MPECFQKQVMEVDFPNGKIKVAEKHRKISNEKKIYREDFQHQKGTFH